jgi:hypothetical protein
VPVNTVPAIAVFVPLVANTVAVVSETEVTTVDEG